MSAGKTLWRVTLPLIRPAIAAGLALVVVYVVSDFGAVSLLRYETLTYATYRQMTGRYDQSAASILSLLLVFGISFGIPAGMLLQWSLTAVPQGALDTRFFGFIWNSGFLSALAASGAVMIGLPPVYLASRRPSRLNLACLRAGYALPGPVTALAILTLLTQFVPALYGSIILLIVPYVLHFIPVGIQSMEPALQQVTPNVEEAARTLGCTTRQTLRRMTPPLIHAGCIAAWALIFLQTVKELPATLLLRPVGFDTLAIRVWLEASKEYYQLAAPSARLIVLLSVPALFLLVAKDCRWRNQEAITCTV